MAAIIGTCITFASIRLDHPGLNYDETLFFNAALGGEGSGFVYRRLFGIPTMLMSYIGALRAYVYYPVFRIFGVSPATVRLPPILLTALALFIAYLLARRFMPRWLAVLFLSLIATSPAIVINARVDIGVILMTLFKLAAIYLLFRYFENKRLLHLFLFYAVLLLGVFDKLNFLWFIAALAIATPLALWPELRECFLERPSKALLLSGSALGMGALILGSTLPSALNDTSGIQKGLTLGDQLSNVIHLYSATFNGTAFYWNIFSRQINSTTFTPWIVLPAGLLGTVAIAGLLGKGYQRRPLAFRLRVGWFFLLLFIVTFGIMIVTPQTSGPHHLMMLWTFPEFAAFIFIAEIASRLREAGSRRVFIAVFVSTAIVVAGHLFVASNYLATLLRPGPYAVAWTPAIYRLSDYLEKQSERADKIILADWGMGTQLYGLAEPNERTKYLDYWPTFVNLPNAKAESAALTARFLFENQRVLVVTHVPSKEIFRGTRNAFLSLASSFNLKVNQIATITSDDKQAEFLVYLVGAE